MEKEVNSKHAERFDYEQGYRNEFLFRLKELGVRNVYEPGSDTGKQNAEFVNLMSATHKALQEEVRSKKIATKYDLEKLVKDPDNFTVQFQKDEQFSPEVETAWRGYKRNYLVDLIKEREKEKIAGSPETRKPSRLKSLSLGLARLTLYGLVTGAAAAAGICAVYEFFIKPDIERKVRENMPYVPTVEEMRAEFLKELRNNQNSLSQDDINRICDTVEDRYPFFKSMKKPAETREEK